MLSFITGSAVYLLRTITKPILDKFVSSPKDTTAVSFVKVSMSFVNKNNNHNYFPSLRKKQRTENRSPVTTFVERYIAPKILRFTSSTKEKESISNRMIGTIKYHMKKEITRATRNIVSSLTENLTRLITRSLTTAILIPIIMPSCIPMSLTARIILPFVTIFVRPITRTIEMMY